MNIAHWEYAGLRIEGLSLAGVRTSLTLPQLSLGFDVANGLPHAISMNTFLISHGHMDHASGIPYIISQIAMKSHRTPRFIMPEAMVGPMKEIMRQWSLIESHAYKFEFIGARPGDEIKLTGNIFTRPFKTIHRIPSCGYSLYRKVKKLRSEFSGLPGDELALIRKQGLDPSEEKTELLVSFTGDTQIEFLDHSPHVKESKILIMEATYLDETKPISNAKEWGHTHLEELIPRLESIQSEKIMLIHSSARYSLEEAYKILQRRLPAHERERVFIFGGR